MTGALDAINGLILGKFTHCDMPDPAKPHRKIEELLVECGEWSPAPSIRNFCYGHVPRKLTVPFGVEAELDAARGQVKLLEAAVC